MLKSDSWIRENCLKNKMISPFVEKLVAKGRISYGLSSYGYDIRVANEYKVFTDVHNCVVDPKEFNSKSFVDIKAPYCIVPAHSFALSRSVEYFRIPRGVIGLCIGKSTYARCGIVVNITPLEPEWEGHLTLEISNTTPLPAKIYSDEGIAQLIFLESDKICEISYKDRKGKYQSQRGVTLPRIMKGLGARG